jgi:hypothetical protein
MLEAEAATGSLGRRPLWWARAGLRLLFGYVLGVSAGVVVFMATLPLAGGTIFRPDETGLGPIADILLNAAFYFYIGAVFGLPYAIIATIVFMRWLPRSMPLFLLLGALCPTASVLLMLTAIDGWWLLDRQLVTFLTLTLPAGLAAAYVFGAIGMGWGFRQWRFG